MTRGVSLRLMADAVAVATIDELRTATGTIEAQPAEWWAWLSGQAAGGDEIQVVLDPPESFAVRLPGLPRSRRETELLVDRLSPIRRKDLTLSSPHRTVDGIVTVAIAHRDRLQTLRRMFADHGLPPPLLLSPENVAFEQEALRADPAMRMTVAFVLASVLALPIVCSVGATLLTHRIDVETAVLRRSRQVDGNSATVFAELRAEPTIAARVTRISRHLPDEGTIVAIGSDGGRRLAITVDQANPDSLKLAMARAGTFTALREDARERMADGDRLTYSGVPR